MTESPREFKVPRVIRIERETKALVTPAYFPAVSSVWVTHQVDALMRLVLLNKYPRLLVSAYDLHSMAPKQQDEMVTRLRDYRMHDCFVFLDSGTFEAFWKRDRNWTIDPFTKTIEGVSCDFYSCFDIFPRTPSQDEEFYRDTLSNISESQLPAKGSICVPILHGREPSQVLTLLTKLLATYPDLSKIIAVPERDLGQTITKRAKTIARLRQKLDENAGHRLLHILGCGNPLSIALFAQFGANMFDSLDWTRFILDPDTLNVREFSQLELLNCDCPICVGERRDPIEKGLLHNLMFYQQFMLRVQEMIRTDTLLSFLSDRIGTDYLSKVGE